MLTRGTGAASVVISCICHSATDWKCLEVRELVDVVEPCSEGIKNELACIG